MHKKTVLGIFVIGIEFRGLFQGLTKHLENAIVANAINISTDR
jgi:hypothetical protein